MTHTRNHARRFATLTVAVIAVGGLFGQTHTQQQKAPIKLGTSGGSAANITSSYCCSGTLGAQVADSSGQTYILSNNHILAEDNLGQIGDAIMQRGYVDTVPPCSTTGTIVVANLSKFVPISFTTHNAVDAAIAATVSGQVATNGAILGIGPVSRTPVAAAVNMAVEKSGRSGVSSGTISQVGVTAAVGGYGVCGCGQSGQPACQTAVFVKQIGITPGTFIQPGDSGSLVVKTPAAGARANPVGLIFAGSSSMAIANPISSVLKLLGVTMAAPASTAAELAEANIAADPEVERALAVKDRYNDFLFSLPEVVGHGVGKDASGHAVINLFLRQATDAARRAAPLSLEGIPVAIIETGEFRVHPECSAPAQQARN